MITQEEQEKGYQELATAMLQAFKFEVVYRRALAYSRKDDWHREAWANFARWANVKLAEAVDRENDALKRADFGVQGRTNAHG